MSFLREPAVLVLLSPMILAGCLDQDTFIGPPTGEGVFTFAMTDTTPPIVGEFVHVETRIELPIVPPTDEEFAALSANPVVPYGRQPWINHRDFDMEVDVTVKNLDDTQRTFLLVADGISEFHEYVPGYLVEIENGEEEVTPNTSQWERNVLVPPNGVFSWTIRREHFDEVAVDLATIANGVPNRNQVNFLPNHSSTDPRAQPFIPEQIAGLVGLRLGILREGPANLVVEASVRIRDDSGRLADPEDPDAWWTLPVPEIFMAMVEDPPP